MAKKFQGTKIRKGSSTVRSLGTSLLIFLTSEGEIKGEVQETNFQIQQVQKTDQTEFNGHLGRFL